MQDYIANSKNRKLKKRILLFLSRIDFGREKLPMSGKFLLLLDAMVFASLVFPWFHFTLLSGEVITVTAFSLYTGYVGYGILLSCFIIPFFLLSHTKKEFIRAHIPFRLSDTQAIVFIIGMLITAMIHLILMTRSFQQFISLEISVGSAFLFSFTSMILMLPVAYFFSRDTKEHALEVRHIDHQIPERYGDYSSIIQWTHTSGKDENSNMKLPI
jgi:hypothetical protein